MNSLEAVRLICDSLRADPQGDDALRSKFLATPTDYRVIVASASWQLITPALYGNLRRRAFWLELPEEFRDHLEGAWELNRIRNSKILEQLQEAAVALNVAGITPLLLKGSASLLTETYPDFGDRILRDLDLQVTRDELPVAVNVFKALGYREEFSGKTIEFYQTVVKHHYAPMLHLHRQAAVELHHRSLGPLSAQDLLNWTLARTAKPLDEISDTKARRMLVYAPILRVLHNFAHYWAQDQGLVTANLDLRQLYDAAVLTQRYKLELDWDLILKAVDRGKLKRAWACHAFLLNELLGLKIPTHAGTERWGQWTWVRMQLTVRYPLLWKINDYAIRIARRIGLRRTLDKLNGGN